MINANTDMDQHRQLRILVAEYNEINQKLIERILEKAGYAVDIVDNGRDAVDCAGKNRYAFILMDIQMPLMDGQQAAMRIRKAECGIVMAKIPILIPHSPVRIPHSSRYRLWP